MSEPKFKIPTEIIELPSKGLIYPLDNPLSSGTVEMSYMTSRSEDILTNQNYIRQNTVLDKLLESLIVTKIDINDLVLGDKNALMIACHYCNTLSTIDCVRLLINAGSRVNHFNYNKFIGLW